MGNVMDLYARAAATLYGIISFDDFFRILDTYYGEGALSQEKIMRYFWDAKGQDPLYYIQGDLIVHASIPPNEVTQTLSEIQHPLGVTAPQHHKILPEEEFLRYANPLCYEDSPGTRNMEAYLVALEIPPEEAREIVAEMAFICRSGASPTFVMDALNRRGYPMKRKEYKLDLMLMALDLEAETHQWVRLGATGSEMAGR